MIDLKLIEVAQGLSLYQVFGFLTITLAIINLCLYAIVVYIIKDTNHNITKALKHKVVIEMFLTFTTVLMGFGAFLTTSYGFWQFAYVFRVGLLLLSPIVLYRLVMVCLEIVEVKDKDGTDINK